jgi:hypothetical protein
MHISQNQDASAFEGSPVLADVKKDAFGPAFGFFTRRHGDGKQEKTSMKNLLAEAQVLLEALMPRAEGSSYDPIIGRWSVGAA